MGKLRRVLKQVCLLHKGELDFLRGENERLTEENQRLTGLAMTNQQRFRAGLEAKTLEELQGDSPEMREAVMLRLLEQEKADSAKLRAENEKLQAAMNFGSITISSQGVSAISNGETWTYKAFDLPESGTIQDILIEKNTGLEMAVAILTADRDNLKEAKAKAEYEAQNFAKDRDAWKEAYDVLKVDCGPIELTRLPDRCEDCEWKELAETRSAEIAELEKVCTGLRTRQDEWKESWEASRLETKRAIERADAIENELSTRAQQFREEKRELSITIEDLKDKLTAAINDLQATRTECTCHTEDNQWYECPVCEIARLKRAGFCVDRSAEKQALEERVKFLEAELDRFDARGIEQLKAEMDKADRLKAELEEVRAAYVTAASYRDRVRAAVGSLSKVASSE